MGCASGVMAQQEKKVPTAKELQTAWDAHVCSAVLPQGPPRSDNPQKRRKPRSRIPMKKSASIVVNSFGLQSQESLVCGQTDQPLIILDWDDNLYPSTWVKERMGQTPTVEQALRILQNSEHDFRELSSRTVGLLSAAMELGSVVILTTSRAAWMGSCWDKFMPGAKYILNATPKFYVLDYLKLDEQDGPLSRAGLTDAKARAASTIISSIGARHTSGLWRNIVYIGGNPAEHHAIKHFAREGLDKRVDAQHCRMTTVALRERPCLDLVILQVSMLLSQLRRIVLFDGHDEYDVINNED